MLEQSASVSLTARTLIVVAITSAVPLWMAFGTAAAFSMPLGAVPTLGLLAASEHAANQHRAGVEGRGRRARRLLRFSLWLAAATSWCLVLASVSAVLALWFGTGPAPALRVIADDRVLAIAAAATLIPTLAPTLQVTHAAVMPWLARRFARAAVVRRTAFALYLRPFDCDDVMVREPEPPAIGVVVPTIALTVAAQAVGVPAGAAFGAARAVINAHQRTLALPISMDQLLAAALPQFTVLAVGERVAPPALFVPLEDDTWQDWITKLVEAALLVLVVVDDSDGLLWELRTLRERGVPERILIVTQPDWNSFVERHQRWWLVAPRLRETGWSFPEASPPPGTIYAVDPDWRLYPIAEAARCEEDYARAIVTHLEHAAREDLERRRNSCG